MSKTEPEAHLTPQERSVIERTVNTASEILDKIMSKHTKERAILLCKPHRQSTKSMASTSLLFNIVDGNQELPARREHIRERLPAEINKSDVSDILQYIVRQGFLKNPKKIVRARGKPKGLGFKDSNRGGRPSYYDKSPELKESIEVLKNRNVLRSINDRLIETGVLPKFLKYRNLVSYYLIRMDENRYWQTLKPFPFIKETLTKRPKSIQLYLDKIRSLGEDRQTSEDTALIISQMCMLNSQINLLIFTHSGKRHGLVDELSFLTTDPRMVQKIDFSLAFDKVYRQRSSIPALSMDRVKRYGVQRREFKTSRQLKEIIVKEIYWLMVKWADRFAYQ